jgi:hypothetical protein
MAPRGPQAGGDAIPAGTCATFFRRLVGALISSRLGDGRRGPAQESDCDDARSGGPGPFDLVWGSVIVVLWRAGLDFIPAG